MNFGLSLLVGIWPLSFAGVREVALIPNKSVVRPFRVVPISCHTGVLSPQHEADPPAIAVPACAKASAKASGGQEPRTTFLHFELSF